MKKEIFDYRETVAEEITLTTGLKTLVTDEAIEVDTIAGVIHFKVAFYELMEDVYRFIYIYGMTLKKYGIENRIKLKTNL